MSIIPGQVVSCPHCGTKNRVLVGGRGKPRCASCHQDLPWLVNAADADFAAAVDTGRLVLVDLWAPWCGPCRMVAPVLERLSIELAGTLKVVKVNVDDNPQVATRYQATSIPMLLLMRDGDVVETVLGAQPYPALKAAVDRHL